MVKCHQGHLAKDQSIVVRPLSYMVETIRKTQDKIVVLDHRQNRTDSRYKQLWQRLQTDKIAQQSPDTIKALEEILGSLRITKANISNKKTELVIPETLDAMLKALVVYNETVQTVILKNMVLDLGQFDKDRTKFEDWWIGIYLLFKSNKVIAIDNKITIVLV